MHGRFNKHTYAWYHAYVEIFCVRHVTAAILLIAKGWLKLVKKETWSNSGRCPVCKYLEFFLGIPNASTAVAWTTKKYYRLVATSLFRVASERARELSLSSTPFEK